MNLSNLTIWHELAILIGAGVLIYIGRILPFKEKKTKEPEKTIMATVISKEIKSGTHQSGRSKGGFSYAITFMTEEGKELELFVYEIEFGGLKEGMKGELTYKGRYFVDFK